MRISAKADYAVRAAAELAVASDGLPVKGEALAQRQDVPLKFLENILSAMRTAGIVQTRRGADGGYLLARDAEDVTVADVIRAVDGPLAAVRGEPPEGLVYPGPAEQLVEVWVAVRASLRAVLEQVTIADLAVGQLPAVVRELAAEPEAWHRR